MFSSRPILDRAKYYRPEMEVGVLFSAEENANIALGCGTTAGGAL
ncbi:hypothetical protein JHV666_49110 [Mycobacterium avium subsp. hominissuis]